MKNKELPESDGLSLNKNGLPEPIKLHESAKAVFESARKSYEASHKTVMALAEKNKAEIRALLQKEPCKMDKSIKAVFESAKKSFDSRHKSLVSFVEKQKQREPTPPQLSSITTIHESIHFESWVKYADFDNHTVCMMDLDVSHVAIFHRLSEAEKVYLSGEIFNKYDGSNLQEVLSRAFD
jgi:hypothetical protein